MKHRTLQDARKADPSLWEIKKNAEGKPLCRMCSGVVKPPRRSFCGEACVHEYKIRSDIRYARRQVRKRDKGVCAICKVNTKEQEKEVWKLATHAQRVVKAAEFGVPKHRVGDSYWDMDHIIPVSEGGGASGLENLRTLCIPCHKKETAALRKRLASKDSSDTDSCSKNLDEEEKKPSE